MGHVKPQLSPSSGSHLVGQGERLLSNGLQASAGSLPRGPGHLGPPCSASAWAEVRKAAPVVHSICGKGRCRWEGRCSWQDLGVKELGVSRGDGVGYNLCEKPQSILPQSVKPVVYESFLCVCLVL